MNKETDDFLDSFFREKGLILWYELYLELWTLKKVHNSGFLYIFTLIPPYNGNNGKKTIYEN